jgi:hypothetical protein
MQQLQDRMLAIASDTGADPGTDSGMLLVWSGRILVSAAARRAGFAAHQRGLAVDAPPQRSSSSCPAKNTSLSLLLHVLCGCRRCCCAPARFKQLPS